MTASEIASVFKAKRSGNNRWRAKCPAHKSNRLTLALYSGKDRVSITCFFGCHSDDVMAAVGLTWRNLLYQDTTLTPEEKKSWAKKRLAEYRATREQRMQDLKMMIRVIENPPARSIDTFQEDIDEFCKGLCPQGPFSQ